jgi:hypothetical protein
MKLAYDFYKSILLVDSRLNKEIFLEYAAARSGYALEMFSRMYDSITSELINLEKQFCDYYAFEYITLERFLYIKYNIEEADIEKIMQEKQANSHCVVYKRKDYAYGDYGLDDFAFSDPMYERIRDILLMKFDKHENKI